MTNIDTLFSPADARAFLGSQLWLEPTESEERIDMLFGKAADTGLGWARLFLMWPWIEPAPGGWDFSLFDRAFDAAQRHGIKIKATLTANSPAWHVGTPSVLHSHTGILHEAQRPRMREYAERCVTRYRHHPALGQWILWNEPMQVVPMRAHEGYLAFWRGWLRERYRGDIGALNTKWRTGYPSFDEVPFCEDVPHPAHKDWCWNAYGPWLDNDACSRAYLVHPIQWLREIVRRHDATTPLCVNPTGVLGQAGAPNEELSRAVDIIGCSLHPAWHFSFANRRRYPALVAAGVYTLRGLSSQPRVEVTELQSGNTWLSGFKPNDVTPAELVRFHLAALAAGAESVTGWCFNSRRAEFEVGEWNLLDDYDQPSERSAAVQRLHRCLDAVLRRLGPWRPASREVAVLVSGEAQAIERVARSRQVGGVSGRGENPHCAAVLIAAEAMALGRPVAIKDISNLENAFSAPVLVASGLASWQQSEIDSLLSRVDEGATLLVDGTCGRLNCQTELYRPWPGGLAERTGLRARRLESRGEGYPLLLDGLPAGAAPLTRTRCELTDAAWQAVPGLRFTLDGEPVVYERSFGKGRILYCRVQLGGALQESEAGSPWARWLLKRACDSLPPAVRPLTGGQAGGAICLRVRTPAADLHVVLTDDLIAREGQPVVLALPAGRYFDFWSETEITATAGEATLLCADGIALLAKIQMTAGGARTPFRSALP